MKVIDNKKLLTSLTYNEPNSRDQYLPTSLEINNQQAKIIKSDHKIRFWKKIFWAKMCSKGFIRFSYLNVKNDMWYPSGGSWSWELILLLIVSNFESENLLKHNYLCRGLSDYL